MSWESDDYSYDTDMLGDSPRRRRTSSKTKIPKFKPIVKKRIPHTEFGSAMAGLTMGMLFIFPMLSLLLMGSPQTYLLVIGIIGGFFGLIAKSGKFALFFMGILIVFTLLGFVSIGFYKAILG